MTYSTSSDTEYYPPLNFENLDNESNPDFGKTVVSIKADGRAWAYKKDKNYWYLVDISILRFDGINPVVVSTNDAEVIYSIDLNSVTTLN